MKIFRSTLAPVMVIVALLAFGCAEAQYKRSDVGQAPSSGRFQSLDEGEIIKVRKVIVEGEKSAVGVLAGAGTGLLLGSLFGRGTGKVLAMGAGAVAGGIAGSKVEEKATRTEALEITVKLENGEVVTVLQKQYDHFEVGDTVKVLRRSNGQAEVLQ